MRKGEATQARHLHCLRRTETDRASKALGYAGLALQAGIAVCDIGYGDGLQASEAFDLAVGIVLTVVVISHPIGLLFIAGYGIIDAAGWLDEKKEDLGGNTTIIEGGQFR